MAYEMYYQEYKLAASAQNYDQVIEILARGFNPDTETTYNHNVLLDAAISNDTEIVSILLQAGARPVVRERHKQYDEFEPLYHAVKHNNIDMLNELLNYDVITADGHINKQNTSSVIGPSEFNRGNNAIRHAVKLKHFKILDQLIAHGMVVSLNDVKETFADIIASGDLVSAKAIVKRLQASHKKLSFNLTLFTSKSLLMEALENNHRDVFYWLVENGADINASNHINEGPLLYAMRHNDIELARYAVDKGANIIDMVGYAHSPSTLLMEAADTGNVEFVSLLLDTYEKRNSGFFNKLFHKPYKHLDVNPYRGYGSPLVIAAKQGNAKIIKALLQHGANPLIWEDDRLPAHHAIVGGDLTSFRLLMDAGTPVLLDNNQVSLLDIAVYPARLDIIEYLLQKGADVNSRDSFNDRSSPLDSAIYEKVDVKIVQLLIDSGADVNALDRKNNSYLHDYMEGITLETLQVLIDAGIDLNQANDKGKTPLSRAMLSGRVEVSRLLQKNNAVDSRINALHQAVFEDDAQTIISLLKTSPDLSQADESFETPIVLGVINRRLIALQALLSHGMDINSRSRNGDTLLLNAIRRKDTETIDLLLSHNANTNLYGKHDDSPLLLAVEKLNLPLLEKLLSHGADVLLSKNENQSALYEAYRYSDKSEQHQSILQAILKHSFPVKKNNREKALKFVESISEDIPAITYKANKFQSRELLSIATLAFDKNKPQNSNDRHRFRLDDDIQQASKDSSKLTWLDYYIEHHPLSRQELLTDSSNYAICETYSLEAVEFMVRKGLKTTPELLRYCLHKGEPLKSTALLISPGKEFIQKINDLDSYEHSLLMRAAEAGHVDAVRRLIALGADATITDNYGDAALMKGLEYPEIVAELIDYPIDVQKTDSRGWGLLIQAAKTQNPLQVIPLLINKYPDIPGATEDNINSLGNRKYEVRELLLQHAKQSSNNAGSGNITVSKQIVPTVEHLFESIEETDGTYVKQLLQRGANPESIKGEYSALTLAAHLGDANAVNALLDASASANSPAPSGLTALHYAALEGQSGIIPLLLKAGADINALDKHGNTALILAMKSRSVYSAKKLLELGANAELKNNQGENAAEIAIEQKLLNHKKQAKNSSGDNNTDENPLANLQINFNAQFEHYRKREFEAVNTSKGVEISMENMLISSPYVNDETLKNARYYLLSDTGNKEVGNLTGFVLSAPDFRYANSFYAGVDIGEMFWLGCDKSLNCYPIVESFWPDISEF